MRVLLALLLAVFVLRAEDLDPCEGLLQEASSRPVRPGQILDAISGDTLRVQIKGLGIRRVKLAGLRAPRQGEPLAEVSRFHLSRLAKGLRTFLVMDEATDAAGSDATGKVGAEPILAVVEDLAEAQLVAGMGVLVERELGVMGEYGACRSRKAEAQARRSRAGIWP